MAEMLIDQLAGDYEPDDYEDDYALALKELVQAKVEGGEIQVRRPSPRTSPARSSTCSRPGPLGREGQGLPRRGPLGPPKAPAKKAATKTAAKKTPQEGPAKKAPARRPRRGQRAEPLAGRRRRGPQDRSVPPHEQHAVGGRCEAPWPTPA